MEITAPCVVTLTWALQDAQGGPIDELKEPLEFFFGGDDLLAKVEEALAGHEQGFETTLHLEPEHAFGDYEAARVCFEDRALFPADLREGMQLEGLPAGARTQGMPDDAVYTVTEIYPSHVVLDGNHPLAGIALRLHLKVHDVRAASDTELQRGSVGGELFSLADPLPGSGTLH
ncbi:MAG TPA: peptidylprolyl isomerase [Burkholderiaceae bacterium]|nr:peptidylprolyl isomerase [Burkholderiaceae bacterium]